MQKTGVKSFVSPRFFYMGIIDCDGIFHQFQPSRSRLTGAHNTGFRFQAPLEGSPGGAVERFGINSPVDCPSEGQSPEGRAFRNKQSCGLFMENKPTGTPGFPEGEARCAVR